MHHESSVIKTLNHHHHPLKVHSAHPTKPSTPQRPSAHPPPYSSHDSSSSSAGPMHTDCATCYCAAATARAPYFALSRCCRSRMSWCRSICLRNGGRGRLGDVGDGIVERVAKSRVWLCSASEAVALRGCLDMVLGRGLVLVLRDCLVEGFEAVGVRSLVRVGEAVGSRGKVVVLHLVAAAGGSVVPTPGRASRASGPSWAVAGEQGRLLSSQCVVAAGVYFERRVCGCDLVRLSSKH